MTLLRLTLQCSCVAMALCFTAIAKPQPGRPSQQHPTVVAGATQPTVDNGTNDSVAKRFDESDGLRDLMNSIDDAQKHLSELHSSQSVETDGFLQDSIADVQSQAVVLRDFFATQEDKKLKKPLKSFDKTVEALSRSWDAFESSASGGHFSDPPSKLTPRLSALRAAAQKLARKAGLASR